MAFRQRFLTFFLQFRVDANRGYGRALARGGELLAGFRLPKNTLRLISEYRNSRITYLPAGLYSVSCLTGFSGPGIFAQGVGYEHHWEASVVNVVIPFVDGILGPVFR